MANKRDTSKRLKGFGIPIETCIKYERLAGVKTNEEPTKAQAAAVTRLMVQVLSAGVLDVELTAEDYDQIKQEVKHNEDR